MSDEAKSALARLARMDAELERRGAHRLTLDPRRRRARSLGELAHELVPRMTALPAGTIDAWAGGLTDTATAILAHFPDNLLWDLDHLAASVLRDAARDPARAPARLRASFHEIVDLHALFGRNTPIRFRYVHDFVYGFDWAKWIQRGPPERRSVGPFDLEFLRALRARGGELLALIERDDAVYPRLRGPAARNPFAFSREPPAELRLYQDLARRGLVPVRGWTFDEPPTWDRAFGEEREARARALGLATATPTT